MMAPDLAVELELAAAYGRGQLMEHEESCQRTESVDDELELVPEATTEVVAAEVPLAVVDAPVEVEAPLEVDEPLVDDDEAVAEPASMVK